MYERAYTPERIYELKDNEIFVFGSNLAGAHSGGAARIACERFGAIWGQGVGLQGQCYAIPTMQGGLETIIPYVNGFIEFAFTHRELKFLVTRIGCGIAGFTAYEIAPLFLKVIDLENVLLPRDFVEVMHRHARVEGYPVHTWEADYDFLHWYRPLMEKIRQGQTGEYEKIKRLRRKVFHNTVTLVNEGWYISETKKKYTFPSESEMVRGTIFYSREQNVCSVPTSDVSTRVEVVNGDCLQVAIQVQQQGFRPAVLNMASRQNPGGGVSSGAGAQEETLFRRTNLFRSLYQFVPYAGEYGVKEAGERYPLDRNFGGIYTPNAICFREPEQDGYALMDEPVSLSFISVAGMNRPDLTEEGMIAPYHVEGIKNKIRTIFRIGLLHGHDALVLGALGCGAFRNPPRHVARLFHEVMNENEFANKYRYIVFAILEDHNSHHGHNPEGNFKPFVEEFGKYQQL